MLAIKRVCKFFYVCRFADGKSRICITGGGDYCGVYRTLSLLQKEKGEKEMKKKDEREVDLGLKQLGVTPRIYHLKEMWPFEGVTIVTADRVGSFYTVLNMVQKAISMHTLNKATKTKKNLNDLGIYGIAICDVHDEYNKKRGRTIAKGRLWKHLKQLAEK